MKSWWPLFLALKTRPFGPKVTFLFLNVPRGGGSTGLGNIPKKYHFLRFPLHTQDKEMILTHSSNSSCLIINANKMSPILSRNHINTLKRIMIVNKLKTFPIDKSSIKVGSSPKRREAFSETRWKGKNENDNVDCDGDDDDDYSGNLDDDGGDNDAQREIYFRRRFHK